MPGTNRNVNSGRIPKCSGVLAQKMYTVTRDINRKSTLIHHVLCRPMQFIYKE